MRAVQIVIAVAPSALVLYWGVIAVRDAGNLLLAPGVPVRGAYLSPGGPVAISAEGYNFDPKTWSAEVWGLKAVGPRREPLAAVQYITAKGLNPLALKPAVQLRGLDARLERDRTGFSILRYLPKREGKPSEIPYSVEVLDAHVAYVDRALARPLVQSARSDRVTVDGVGDDWRASGRVALLGIGNADVVTQSIAKVGITIDLFTDVLRLERVVPSVLPGLEAERITVRGPMRVDLPKIGKARVALTLNADGEKLRYKQYAIDSVAFDGKLSDQGGTGIAEARIGDISARFQGSATTKEGGGQVRASVPSPRSLPTWARKLLPPKVDFSDARYDGWVAWRPRDVRVQGGVRAASASYGKDWLTGLRAQVAYGPQGLQVRSGTAVWKESTIAGDLAYDPKSRGIRAAILAPQVDLQAVLARLGGPPRLSGHLGGSALVSGTLDRPAVEARVSGPLVLQGRALGDIEARGAWLNGAARVDRVRLSGPLGAVIAGGTVRSDGTLALHAEARGLRVERLAPEAHGLVSANLDVGGTLRDPKAKGRIEAYRLAFQDQRLPAAAVEVTADKRKIELTGLQAVRGTARLRGRATASLTGRGVSLADPRTWPIAGRFSLTGVQANELPGSDQIGDIAGLLSITGGELSGRVGDPVVQASLEGDGLIVRGVRAESLRADARVDRRHLLLSGFEGILAGGRVSGSGGYAFRTKEGGANIQAAGLQLSRLLTDISEDVLVEGTLDAPAVHLAFRDGSLVGAAEGTLRGVRVNGVLAGDGNWDLKGEGTKVVANASVGRLDPTLRALDANATFDLQTKTVAATVAAKDLPLQALIAAARAKTETSEEEAARIATIAGDVSGEASIERNQSGAWEVNATGLKAAGLRYQNQDYGTLTATSLARQANRWTVDGAVLEGPEGRLGLGGWVEENGTVDLRLTGAAMRLSAFSPFVADVSQVAAIVDFDLHGTGSYDRPHVAGNATVGNLLSTDPEQAVAVQFTQIDVNDGKSRIDGILRYGSRFGGLFSATSDWRYREDINGANLTASIDLGELRGSDPLDPTKLEVTPVSLIDIPGLNSYVDASRGGGTLTGHFSADGTVRAPRLEGGLELIASQLGITVPGQPGRPVTRVDDLLKNVDVKLGFEGRNRPVVTAHAESSRGGAMDARLALGEANGADPLTALRESKDWRKIPIDGSVTLDKLSARQGVAGGRTAATIEGKANVAGTVYRPEITGLFAVSGFDTTFPDLEAGESASGPPLIDPSFDLTLALSEPGRFRTATADLWLNGDLAVKGSLSRPTATAELVTERGSIRLPGGIIRVQPGGQISFAYKRPLAGGPPASANLDLQGRSFITTSRYGGSSQRYDVTLDVRGDLLREGGLQFDATSDPPDLSKDEILAALGQKELLESVGQGGSAAERRLRSAFVGFALPGLLDTVTGGIARGLGLEYLSLEYNEYDQATVAFAQSLGPDFSFQGRQQIGTPTPGYRSVYDLRLVYNPRRLLPKLNRFSFSIGTDQDRPWKASVEYGTRFGSGKGNPKPKHVLFPALPKKG